MMIKRILVPVDGSDCSMRALDLACDMAGRYEAKVVLLHVVPNQPVPQELRRFAEVEHLAEQTVPRHLADRMLDSAHDRARRSGLRDPKCDVRVGS
ncbi:MAG: universal stress protein, partial [Alphaproteobacteria bacterium]